MHKSKIKIIRTSTISFSLDNLLRGQLKFLNQFFDVIAVSGRDQYLENLSVREGVRVININFSRGISFINDILCFIKLCILFYRERPTIVHSITPKAGLLSMAAGYICNVPIRIHTFTGLVFESRSGLFKRILIFSDKITCFFATNIYPEGQCVSKLLTENKITKKSLRVIANGNINGVDIDLFNPSNYNQQSKSELKKRIGLEEHDFVFTFIGRIRKDKGIGELVMAFLKLVNENQNLKLKLLLVGPDENELDPLVPSIISILNTHPLILVLGFQTNIPQYLSISNCFILPSYREGFPNSLLQACSMGIPSIVTDVCGSNEIITSENGLIIKKENDLALYDAMLYMYNNIDKFDKTRIRLDIEKRFSNTIVWESILEEYKRLLNIISI